MGNTKAKEYTVEVVEEVTRSGHLSVVAQSEEEAEEKARDMWKNGEMDIEMSDGDEPELTHVFVTD